MATPATSSARSGSFRAEAPPEGGAGTCGRRRTELYFASVKRGLTHPRQYLRFREGAVGEYNGKIHVQPVRAAGRFLRHTAGPRPRELPEFFPGAHGWQIAGLRLAEHA